ncbi:MAG: integration host factor subunit beta [Akkermansiaceae bacterium]|nr:integration host factor subunit beta [Akkermansia sp.]MCD7799572.1 integration host factor subunit beta [Akkermansiaceae bacterium]
MARTLTKRDLVNRISADSKNLTQSEVFDVIQKAVGIITETLGRGDRVVIRNFGTFQVKTVKAKVGRNPKNPAKDVPIPARSVVKFKVGKTLKETVVKIKVA